jgi:hypothetical protein
MSFLIATFCFLCNFCKISNETNGPNKEKSNNMNVFHNSFKQFKQLKKLWNVNMCYEIDMVTFCFRSLRREDSFVFRESPASWKWRCVSHLVIRLWQCCVQWHRRKRKWIQVSTSCLTNCSSRYSRTFLTMTTGASDWWIVVSTTYPTTNHCGKRFVLNVN